MPHLSHLLAASGMLVLGTAARAYECDENLPRLESRVKAYETQVNRDPSPNVDANGIGTLRTLVDAARILKINGRTDACGSALEEVADRLAQLEREPVLSAERLLDSRVEDSRREEIGTVEHVVFHRHPGAVPFAVVRVGGVLGLGGDLRPVPFASLNPTADEKRFELAISPQRLENAPAYDEDLKAPAEMDKWLLAVHDFYRLRAPEVLPSNDESNARVTRLSSRKDGATLPTNAEQPAQAAKDSWSGTTSKDTQEPEPPQSASRYYSPEPAVRAGGSAPGTAQNTRVLERIEQRLARMQERIESLQERQEILGNRGESAADERSGLTESDVEREVNVTSARPVKVGGSDTARTPSAEPDAPATKSPGEGGPAVAATVDTQNERVSSDGRNSGVAGSGADVARGSSSGSDAAEENRTGRDSESSKGKPYSAVKDHEKTTQSHAAADDASTMAGKAIRAVRGTDDPDSREIGEAGGGGEARFGKLDRNRDGYLNVEEAAADFDVRYAYHELDVNGDKRLDSTEFKAFEPRDR